MSSGNTVLQILASGPRKRSKAVSPVVAGLGSAGRVDAKLPDILLTVPLSALRVLA